MNIETITHIFSESHPEIQVELHRSARAKRYILKRKFTSKTFVLTVPVRGTRKQALEFLSRSNGWILTQYAKSKDKIDINISKKIPIQGEMFHVKHFEKRGLTKHYTQEDGTKIIHVSGTSQFSTRRIQDYLKKLALEAYTQAANHHTQKLGKTFTKIRLNDPKTRWGSCSSNGTLSFSWRLIMAPHYVLYYLVAHEVAHLQHMNHSAQFWHTVAELDPNWKAAEHWLKYNGSTLHLMI